MGEMKRLAVRLAVCVYRYHMSDEEIISIFKSIDNNFSQYDLETWLLVQLRVVRNNPQIYQGMGD